jgi:hypothetical protein
MQPFNPLGSGATVSSVIGPTGAVGVSPSMYDASGSYSANGTSNYLVSNGSVSAETFTMPAGTGAFYVYGGWECNCGGGGAPTSISITATAQDGTSSGPVMVNIGAPEYFGFYAACGSALQTIKLSVTGQPWTLTAGAFGIAPVTCPTKPQTGAQVVCNYVFATFDDICSVAVSSGTSTSPTGSVTFVSSQGGVFSVGSSCSLTPVAGHPGISSCSVRYIPPATGSPTITATYGGDANNPTVSATTNALLSQSVAAVISGFGVSPPSFFAAPTGPSFVMITRVVGAIVRFRLKAPAVVRFTVQRSRPGRKGSKGLCAAPSKRNAGSARCTRFVALPGGFSLKPRVGENSFRFLGRIGGRTLSAGHYRLVGSPSIAGVVQKAVVVPFTIK